MPERRRFVRGLASWVGFRQQSVSYVREGRFAGESKYPLRKLIRLALNGILSFSYVPLQLASLVGFVLSLVTVVLIPVVIMLRILGSEGLAGGNATLLLAVMLLGGVQLLFLGVIGEYLGVITDEVKRRPSVRRGLRQQPRAVVADGRFQRCQQGDADTEGAPWSR